jgi:hypothetical protein
MKTAVKNLIGRNNSRIKIVICTAAILTSVTACQPKKPTPQSESIAQDPSSLYEVIEFTARPAGAVVNLSTGESCTTPCKVRKSLDSRFTATFQKEGYASASIEVMNNLEKLREFNRARGGRTDTLRVSTLRFSPNPVTATLEPDWSK